MPTVRTLTRLAILIALSAVGASLKVPALTGTPALDSAPGYFAALALGPGQGAVVAAAGHLLTALTAGFPLTIAIHLVIAAGMGGCAAAVAACGARKGPWWAFALGLLLNGVVFPALFLPIPGFGPGFFAAMLIPLLVASALNLGLAALAYQAAVRARLTWVVPRLALAAPMGSRSGAGRAARGSACRKEDAGA
ncbi:MAG: ECF transporter S component [Bacillota bacterium]|nr:ECF transporter S component [Bacillota bacterium]